MSNLTIYGRGGYYQILKGCAVRSKKMLRSTTSTKYSSCGHIDHGLASVSTTVTETLAVAALKTKLVAAATSLTSMTWLSLVASQVCQAMPSGSRPCRRTLLILLVWTCVCYVAFRVGLDGIAPVAGPSDTGLQRLATDFLSSSSYGRSAAAAAGANGHHELLHNVVETHGPRSAFDLSDLGTASTTEINLLEVQPAIDRSPKRDESELVRQLANELPNLPLAYYNPTDIKKDSRYRQQLNSTCARFPRLYDLHISNAYWQEAETSNGTFHLYGAYLDRREKNRLGPTIRILGMINRLEPNVRTYCQMWFAGCKKPIVVKVLEYKYIWYRTWGNYKQGIFQPYLLACQVPKSHWGEVPASVSVVEKPCDMATTNLRVTYNVPADGKRKGFAVCVKGLDFPNDDMSVRLAEWLELLRQLGTDKVFLYMLEVHSNVTKVLKHYAAQGLADVTPLTLPGAQPNIRGLRHLYLQHMLNNKRQNEVIPYNDCLYRNIYRYEYLALLDIDEVIMPLKSANWRDMMKEVVKSALVIKNEIHASYNFRNVYFIDSMLNDHKPEGYFKDIPPYLHMMQHVYRSANYTKPGQYVKCFHDPRRVLVVHNHFPLGCLGGACKSYPVPTELGHLQHYRADCVKTLKKSCAGTYKKATVLDTTIWRYKDEVVRRTTDSLAKLGFFQNYSAPSSSKLRIP